MNNNPYTPPISDTLANKPLQSTPIKLPWTRWIVVVQMLLTFGILSNTIAITLSKSLVTDSQLIDEIKSGLILLTLILMFGVATLRRGYIILSGLFFILIGVFKIKANIHWVIDSPTILTATLAALIYVVPNLLAAWYLLRPSFLHISTQHRKHQDMLAMQRYVSKKFLGG